MSGPKNKLYPDRDGVEGIMGAEVVDGETECRKAVRRQIGAGADWVKVCSRPPSQVLSPSPRLPVIPIRVFILLQVYAGKRQLR